jgi:hypothetical protein
VARASPHAPCPLRGRFPTHLKGFLLRHLFALFAHCIDEPRHFRRFQFSFILFPSVMCEVQLAEKQGRRVRVIGAKGELFSMPFCVTQSKMRPRLGRLANTAGACFRFCNENWSGREPISGSKGHGQCSVVIRNTQTSLCSGA